jgi:SAM-dependent methyltransferase
MIKLPLYGRLHAANRRYGRGGTQYAREIIDFAGRHVGGDDGTPSRVLDFGCGKGDLLDLLRGAGMVAAGYDPALAGFARWPAGATFDLVVCTDVLEHLEEGTEARRHGGAEGSGALERACYLMRSTGAAAFFVAIHCAPAATILPDGSNAHCTVRPAAWWLNYLTGRLCDECILVRNDPPIAVLHGFNDAQNRRGG